MEDKTQPEKKKTGSEKQEEKDKDEVFDPWEILLYPHMTEKSMKTVEAENKLVFIVNRKATKENIAMAVEKGFGVKVISVNTSITSKGLKKAYIKLSEKDSASDIATRLGIV